MRALIDRIKGRTPESVTLPARLVVRQSCGEDATPENPAGTPADPHPQKGNQ